MDTNSTNAVAAEARVTPALPATAVAEFKAKWSILNPLTVRFHFFCFRVLHVLFAMNEELCEGGGDILQGPQPSKLSSNLWFSVMPPSGATL